MPNGTFFRLEIGFSPTHVDAKSITAKVMHESEKMELTTNEEHVRITANILAAIKRLADIVEEQGLEQSIIYDAQGHKIGQYFCRFRD